MLPALTGNLDIPSGNIFGIKLPTAFMRFLERAKENPLGAGEYPLWYQIERSAYLRQVITTILEVKPINKSLDSGRQQSILTWPETATMSSALKELELFVVINPFFTESARLAQVVLLAAIFMERYEHNGHLGAYIAPHITLRREVLPPIGEAKSDILIG